VDIRSIYELTTFVLIGIIAYMLLIQFSTPGLKGVRWLIGGYVCGASGMGLIAARAQLSSNFDVLMSTLFLVLWNVFLYAGFSELLGSKRHLRLYLSISLLPVLLFSNYFIFVQNILSARIAVYSMISVVQYVFLATLLWRNGGPRTKWPRIGISTLFLLWGVAHFLRGVLLLHQWPTTLQQETQGIASFTGLIPPMTGILTCFAFLWLSMAQLQSELEMQSETDMLTGLLNRRALQKLAKRETTFATRNNLPLALLICDLDHFKSVNDRFGHDGGDTALGATVACILEDVRCNDVVARLGGEEFVLVLPGTNESMALQVAERIRIRIANRQIVHHQRQFSLTASFGIATLSILDTDWSDVLLRADRALYCAKADGRNRTVVFNQQVAERQILGGSQQVAMLNSHS
jgi:diguanylate cyclase (GGDEF)-like protein